MIGQMVRTLTRTEIRILEILMEEMDRTACSSVKNPSVIGLIGVMGSGKSTLARYFAEQLSAVIIDEQRIRSMIYAAAMETPGSQASVETIMKHALYAALIAHRNVVWDTDCVYLNDQLRLRALALPFTHRVRFAHVICSDFSKLQQRVGPQSGPQFNASLAHHYKRSRNEYKLFPQPWYLQPPIDTASPQWSLFANRFLETTVY
ncbi:MAG: AAA family ATPase [Candidatus Magasanikbacteria bacterium]|nr:AAA family ATPase [Candidatus Magasanikbacteria bacterium]